MAVGDLRLQCSWKSRRTVYSDPVKVRYSNRRSASMLQLLGTSLRRAHAKAAIQLTPASVQCETYDSVLKLVHKGSDDAVHVHCCCPRIHAFQMCIVPANRTVSHRSHTHVLHRRLACCLHRKQVSRLCSQWHLASSLLLALPGSFPGFPLSATALKTTYDVIVSRPQGQATSLISEAKTAGVWLLSAPAHHDSLAL